MLILEVEHDEQELLRALLEDRVRELVPEIRRSRNQQVHDELHRRKAVFERLADRLRPVAETIAQGSSAPMM